MKRLIVLVLILLFSVPLLTRTTYQPPELAYEFGLRFINELDPTSEEFEFFCDKYVSEIKDELLAFVFDWYWWEKSSFDIDEYWPTEYLSINPSDLKGAVLIDIRPDVWREAGLSIGRTILISLILLIGALMFTN